MATIESYDLSPKKNADGSIRKNAKGKPIVETRYRVRYRTPDHRQTTKRGFKTKRDAEAFSATVEVQKLMGDYVAPALGRVTVAELAPD